MIKVMSIENNDLNTNDYLVSLFADTKAEVEAGGEIVGLPQNAGIEFGSKVITADGQLAYMQSDGNWKWQ
ncbi:MAG: hypothetical protein IKP50_00545 [Bacilli bacterium]|nr:hypothetical protein [Bacilli bacterium]